MSEVLLTKHKKFGRKLPQNGKHYGAAYDCSNCHSAITLLKEEIRQGKIINCIHCQHHWRITEVRGFDSEHIKIQLQIINGSDGA